MTSAGENNYYPSVSPDGAFLLFDRVPLQVVTNPIADRPDCTGTGMQVVCPNSSFSNPKARVTALSLGGGGPVDLANANGSPASAPVDASNSWPRWSPFVETYRGHRLLWVTFSSTRDYGLRVRNHRPGMYPCYPPNSLQQEGTSNSTPLVNACRKPQLWMAAIDLTRLASGGGDPSFPAFWLPFQDATMHNRMAQWAEAAPGLP